jgi:hypothetical protein
MNAPTNAHIDIDQVTASYAEEATAPPGSGYGVMPGSEFPTALYVSVAAAFAWMLGAAWLAFGMDGGTDLDLAMITVLGIVFLGIPAAMHHTAATRFQWAPKRVTAFLSTDVDTWTGVMPARQAWLEVMLIPTALAVAATLIGGVYMLGL